MIKSYRKKINDKWTTLYEVQVSFISKATGKRVQRRSKFLLDDHGNSVGLLISFTKASKFEPIFLHMKKMEDEGRSSNLKFGEYHTLFIKKKSPLNKAGTMTQYEGTLLKWLPASFMFTSLKDIDNQLVSDLIFEKLEKISPEVTPHTQKRVLRDVKAILRSAVDDGYLDRLPISKELKVKTPKTEDRVLTPGEANKLLEFGQRVGHPFYYVWCIALLTGMRSGELFALRWRNVDLDKGLIHVRKQWTSKDGEDDPKRGRRRTIPITKETVQILIELQGIGPFKDNLKGLKRPMDNWVDDLVLPRLKEWRCGNQAKVLREACGLIGITEVRFHDLRASFITNLLSNGVSTSKVMKVVGHSKLSTTEGYLRHTGIEVKGATDKLGFRIPTLEVLNENVFQLSDFRSS